MTDVKLLARWTGWCDPCETERPLVLTETGQRGLRAWLRGVGAEDRTLTLTCGVCGEWQDVPHDEDDLLFDEPMTSPVSALHPLGAHQVVIAAFAPHPSAPPPRTPSAAERSDTALGLLVEGLDLITMAG